MTDETKPPCTGECCVPEESANQVARNAELVEALRNALDNVPTAEDRSLLARIDAEAAANLTTGNDGRTPTAAHSLEDMQHPAPADSQHERPAVCTCCTIHRRLFCGTDWSKDALAAAEAKGRRETFDQCASLFNWLREKAGK